MGGIAGPLNGHDFSCSHELRKANWWHLPVPSHLRKDPDEEVLHEQPQHPGQHRDINDWATAYYWKHHQKFAQDFSKPYKKVLKAMFYKHGVTDILRQNATGTRQHIGAFVPRR